MFQVSPRAKLLVDGRRVEKEDVSLVDDDFKTASPLKNFTMGEVSLVTCQTVERYLGNKFS